MIRPQPREHGREGVPLFGGSCRRGFDVGWRTLNFHHNLQCYSADAGHGRRAVLRTGGQPSRSSPLPVCQWHFEAQSIFTRTPLHFMGAADAIIRVPLTVSPANAYDGERHIGRDDRTCPRSPAQYVRLGRSRTIIIFETTLATGPPNPKTISKRNRVTSWVTMCQFAKIQ